MTSQPPPPPMQAGRLRRFARRQLSWHFSPLPRWYPPAQCLDRALEWWRTPRHVVMAVFFALLCLLFLCQASIHWIAVIDDAYITFRFVDIFSQGHGWRFNVDGPRVEGFTNFLWALLLVVPHWLGGDLMFWSKILGLACAMATMLASWRLARAIRGREDWFNLIAPALLASSSHFSHWALMGLETLLQTALVAGAYWRFEVERRDARCWLISPVLAFLAAATRIDSLYYLSPLGLYGVALVVQRHMPVKRLLLWGLIAAVPFVAFNAWRVAYFGDFFPNTYYAKQRHVVHEGHARGVEHLRQFYFNQGGHGMAEPAPLAQIDGEDPDRRARQLSRILYIGTLASYNSWAWMNFWILSALLTGVSAFTWLLFDRRYTTWRRHRFLREPHAAQALCLILLPWAMNAYYVYHVNGDWMPGFRFLQMALPFIGVAAAVGFGWIGLSAWACFHRRRTRYLPGVGAFVVGLWLLVGTAYEQMDIGHVYVFGKNSVHSGPRQAGWWQWEEVARAYRRGFVPPLEHVSNWMLLNTQGDSAIFMSDIGQPMWYGEHLSLYDVDGLTDPHLAHSPVVRGDLPTVEEHYRGLVESRGEPETREERRRLMEEARRHDFEAHLERNARYIMEEERPEYLLIFRNHPTPDPTTQGWPYPQISERVARHPNMADYVHMKAIPKIGNVYNHFYRRADVEAEVPDEVRYRRLIRAVERNPRIPLLVVLLYEESQRLDISPGQREQVRRIVRRTLHRFPSDQAVSRLARLARGSEDAAVAEEALRVSIRADPSNHANYVALASILEERGEGEAALALLESAVPHQPAYNNSLFYHLVYLAERMGEVDKARRHARMAVERNPRDVRAHSDLASLLDRASHRTDLTIDESVELKRESLGAFEALLEVRGDRPAYITDTMDRLKRQIDQLEGRHSDTPPPRRTPTPPPPTPDMERRPAATVTTPTTPAFPPRHPESYIRLRPTPPAETRYDTPPATRRETAYDAPPPAIPETGYDSPRGGRLETDYDGG